MIDTSTLRIGNIVHANTPPMIVKSINLHEVDLYMPGSEGDCFTYEAQALQPVIITPDILVEVCRFTPNVFKKDTYSIKVRAGMMTNFELSQMGSLFHFDIKMGVWPLTRTFIHLHDLQNFFFTFWEYELPVNIKQL